MYRLIDTSYINHYFKRYLLNGERGVSCRSIKLFLCFVLMFLFLVLKVGINDHSAQAATILQIVEGDEWRYFKGTAKPLYKWTGIDFDDGNWLNGLSGLGYGNSRNRTSLGDMQGNYSTVYARRQFTINNVYAIDYMTLSVVCDGPFIAYIDGIEIIRNASGTLKAEALNVSGFIHELLPGKNVLSVECNNDDISSRDFSFVPVFEVFEH